ncbi:hypothetical protein HWH77_05425 [Bacillus velezensis]|uniref:hypothetical protein n=1 Tax=Bacillus amyloliquefaciens group TaxID=1938374 RepID=UPI001374ED49|nr:hypothetical protein [Bacillus velezensis]QVV95722.1 hypothetical protein KHS93_14545 [Bacillus amyloliquefaciens]NRS34075.1 hypothetical protein [Bacillus velezensis]NRS44621.1 hypothetical protein [Bacillus velezensis]QOX77298.1 hypothetical protein HWH77_05425 [Bacillus velezensis]QYR16222.1 hypothetical protein JHX84_10890 [Bacillus velezensis]
MSWTPNEYKLLLKGAKLREIDELELMARNAMFHRYAMNEKRPKEKKMFDANKARRQLERNITGDNDKWRKSDVNELGKRAKGVQRFNDTIRNHFAKFGQGMG